MIHLVWTAGCWRDVDTRPPVHFGGFYCCPVRFVLEWLLLGTVTQKSSKAFIGVVPTVNCVPMVSLQPTSHARRLLRSTRTREVISVAIIDPSLGIPSVRVSPIETPSRTTDIGSRVPHGVHHPRNGVICT